MIIAFCVTTVYYYFTMMIFVQLFGGLALFLYGMNLCSSSLKSGNSHWLNKQIKRLTKGKLRGTFLGILITLFTQSSSATSVILVSLVNTNLMRLKDTLPVLLGAGIGTTITVQLIAFRLSDYALLLIAFGVLLKYTKPRTLLHHAGELLLGFGMIFFGMHVMSSGLAPLKQAPELQQLLLYFRTSPWLALLVSTLATAVVQSSGATLAVLMSFTANANGNAELSNFLLTAMPMIFGANLGTCITAFLGSIGTSRESHRVAQAQLLMKLLAVIPLMFFVQPLADLVQTITSNNPSRELANAHTLFNLLATLLILPFTGRVMWLINRFYPIKKQEKPFDAIYLDKQLLATPDLALYQVRRELYRQGELVKDQLNRITRLFDRHERELIDQAVVEDDKTDRLQKAVSIYLNRLLAQQQSDTVTREAERLFFINSDLESTADIVVKNIIPLAEKFRTKQRAFSEKGLKELKNLERMVLEQLTLFLEGMLHQETPTLQQIESNSKRIQRRIDAYRSNHLKRLIEGKRETLKTSTIHLDLLDYMRKIENNISEMCRYYREEI